jgi:ATP/maltotriose-dependent transcriptional regulator MalT
MTIISAPAGSGKTSLLWAGRLGQGRRIAFMSVRPGQHDAHRTRQSPESGDGLSPSQR